FLQGNSLTGVLFLVAMFIGNVEMTIAMIVSVIVASLAAIISKLPYDNTLNGLYGFNAALIGCAMIFYFEQNYAVVIAYIIGSVISTFFMHLFLWQGLPAYTFPFIAVSWVLKVILEKAHLAVSKSPGPTIDYYSLDIFMVPSHGFGEVMFQGDAISGILMIVGIFISSPSGAMFGAIGSMVGVVATQLYHPSASISDINAGLYSFNAVLSGIASSNGADTNAIDGLYMIITVSIATIFYIFLGVNHKFTTFTFPFVTSMWALAIWKRLVLSRMIPFIYKKYLRHHMERLQFVPKPHHHNHISKQLKQQQLQQQRQFSDKYDDITIIDNEHQYAIEIIEITNSVMKNNKDIGHLDNYHNNPQLPHR
ncbi:hypothetical protein SAMD00019534_050860, partial [Acytostelium subglobosum LB1]|uniref:hypothetical protein n=1 Tax=Acytostelium subglobosum LB1 TaxID=1410327 RepID=UPI0006451B12